MPTSDDIHVATADESDFAGFINLAAQVEKWFGPMVKVAGFHQALRSSFAARHALCVHDNPNPGLKGGLLFERNGSQHLIAWLVVNAAQRRQGIGHALVTAAIDRFVLAPAVVEVVTFGSDHPAAITGGAREFYESHGFKPSRMAPNGPEGGSRQWFRLQMPQRGGRHPSRR